MRRLLTIPLAALVVLSAVMLLAAVSDGDAGYEHVAVVGATAAPAQEPSIAVSPSVAAPGDTITLTGNPQSPECGPGTGTLILTSAGLFPDGFGPEVPVSVNGFSTTYVIPADTPAGTYEIGMRCGGGNVGVTATLQVTAPATPVPAEPGFTG